MKKFLFFFALTGWFLGLATHILSLADIDIAEKFPFIWLLHIGIFIVWIPIVLNLKQKEEFKSYLKSGLLNPIRAFKAISSETPMWLMVIAIVGFYYVFINFILYSASQHGSAVIKDGQFVLQNREHFIRTLTGQEYHHYQANELRLFSGEWIASYGIAITVLYPFKKTAVSKNLPVSTKKTFF